MKEIPLSQGKVALVDDEDYELVSQYRWAADRRRKSWYARTKINRKPVYMHRLILGCVKGEQVDHANVDGLDNRRRNIRKCSHGDNQHNQHLKKSNKSGYKGVFFIAKSGKYLAFIRYNHRRYHLGYFAKAEDAAAAYDVAARQLRGEFARPNSEVSHAP